MAELPNPNESANSTSRELIDSIKEDGTLTRDSGTNSLKAVKDSIVNLTSSLKVSMQGVGDDFAETIQNLENTTRVQSEETRQKISEGVKAANARRAEEAANQNQMTDTGEPSPLQPLQPEPNDKEEPSPLLPEPNEEEVQQTNYLKSLVDFFRTKQEKLFGSLLSALDEQREGDESRARTALRLAKEKSLEAGRLAKDKVVGAAGSVAEKVKGALPKFNAATLIKALGIGALVAVLTMTGGDFEKLKSFLTDKLIPALKSFYDKGLKPLIDNVIKPFLSIAIPALGDSVLKLIEDVGKFFGGLGEAGKMIREGDYSGAAMKVVTSVGTLVKDLADNILTLGLKLFGVEFAEGETAFGKIGDFFSNMITDITNFVNTTIDDITNYFRETFNSVVDFLDFGPRLTAWFRANIFDGTGERVKIFGNELPEIDLAGIFTDIDTKIRGYVTEIKDNVVNSFMEGIVNPIKNLFTVQETTIDEDGAEVTEEAFSPLQAIKDKIAALNPFAGIFEKIENFFTELKATITEFIPSVDDIKSILPDFGFGEKSEEELKKEIQELKAKQSDAPARDDINSIQDAYTTTKEEYQNEIESLEKELEKMKREKGGPIQADKPYIVGEAGPELIVPSAAGKVIPAPQTGRMLDQASREVIAQAPTIAAPVIAPQTNDNRTIVHNKTVNQGGSMETRNASPTIRALNSTLAYA